MLCEGHGHIGIGYSCISRGHGSISTGYDCISAGPVWKIGKSMEITVASVAYDSCYSADQCYLSAGFYE